MWSALTAELITRQHTSRSIPLHVFALLALAAACADAGDGSLQSAVGDSAAVTIVASASPIWSAGSGWQVSQEPVIELGVAEGAPEVEFQTILGLTRLANGNIVVGNKGTNELRFFSPEGTFIRTVGRRGEGPGEFGAFNGVFPYRGDSLVVWDYRLHRWSVYDTAGTFARVIRPTRPGMNPRSLSPLADGSLIIADNYIESRELRSVDYLRFFRFAPEGQLLDSLGRYRSGEMFRPSNGDPIRIGRIFGASLEWAGAPDGYVIGHGDEYEVLDYASDGRLRRRLRWAGPDRTVTAADLDAYRTDFIARQDRSDPLDQQFARFVTEVPAADRFPAFSTMVRDRVGNIWLAAYPRPRREETRLWAVLNTDGRWLGEVGLPDGLDVWEIGDDYVLGVFHDELSVARVRMYQLQKQY